MKFAKQMTLAAGLFLAGATFLPGTAEAHCGEHAGSCDAYGGTYLVDTACIDRELIEYYDYYVGYCGSSAGCNATTCCDPTPANGYCYTDFAHTCTCPNPYGVPSAFPIGTPGDAMPCGWQGLAGNPCGSGLYNGCLVFNNTPYSAGPCCEHEYECWEGYGCGIEACTNYCCDYGIAHGDPNWCLPGACNLWCSCQ